MMGFKEAHKSFIDDLKAKNRAHATILAYGKDIEQLIDFVLGLGKVELSEVTTSDLGHSMEKLKREGYTPKSISRKTNSTKTFFKFLKSEGLINEDPALALAHPKFEIKPPRILTRLEYRALRDACRNDKRTAAIVELLLQTGIRIGELAQIKTSDINFGEGAENGELGILMNGASRRERTIPLNRAAQNALKEYLGVRPKSVNQTLFITKNGHPLLVRNIRTAIDRYFRIAGIEGAKVNDLRHTFIAHHLKRGTSLVVISKLAGHKRLATTEKYLEYIEKPEEEKIDLGEL